MNRHLPLVRRFNSICVIADTETMDAFFSVSKKLIQTAKPLAFDLFINSSKIENKHHYVRVVRTGQELSRSDLDLLIEKYVQLYVSESQRQAFVNSLLNNLEVPLLDRGSAVKDLAVASLKKLWLDPGSSESIRATRVVASDMVTLLENSQLDQLRSLIGNLQLHDSYTFDHSINVGLYNVLIVKSMYPNIQRDRLVEAALAGLLHDIGKVKIPTSLINKAGKLEDHEFALIKTHPSLGCDCLEDSKESLISPSSAKAVMRTVLEHHENFNGTGYPNKLSGNNIHELARITAISDFFDAITTKRSYHEAVSPEQALAIMSNAKGIKLDPNLLDLFVQYARQFYQMVNTKDALPEDFDPCQPHESLPVGQAQGKSLVKFVDPVAKAVEAHKRKKAA